MGKASFRKQWGKKYLLQNVIYGANYINDDQ